ncbi:MFS transporter [Rhizobiales bacterium RZME27]|uniref:MFS transporter n=1 Tax=Endobacterium cereale TaxID=2663029 RepID=A0A6A8ACI5_9HYPH|nr:MFS transporter [Endobacterium cereale]MEB2847165.1 MFS transporter [Endobacterium cereale]MQY47420.1 MFS transporter [Endobacterium cereale]
MSDPLPASTRMTAYSFVFAVVISATSSAPTPLYHLYQQVFQLSPGTVTLIFGVYAFSLLAALLVFGSLSDHLGRRPLILLSLLLNAAALALFAMADNAGMLIAARIVQGLATGIALPTFGATILDGGSRHGPLINSITAFIGLFLGTLVGGAMVTYVPHPMQAIYLLLLVMTLAGMAGLALMPETTQRRPGAVAALAPNVHVPHQARTALLKVSPVNIACWSLGGLYLSLMPSPVAVTTGIRSPFVGAAVVSTLMLSATASVFLFRALAPRRALLIATSGLMAGVVVSLIGIEQQTVPLLFLGTAIAGLGFGSIFSNVLKIVMPLAEAHQRAGLFAAFLVESYLAFSIPAILAGLAAPVFGLPMTAYVYGAAILALAMISLTAACGDLHVPSGTS